jgi:hypothetical protein
MEGWFEELYNGGGDLQYRYIAKNIDHAIALIQGDSPRVYVLIHEYFEESLRFMEAKFSLQLGATDTFLQSNHYHSRNNQAKYRKKIDTALLTKLHKKYEEWWPEEYRFYNAAVSQFQRHLQRASVQFDPSVFEMPRDLVMSSEQAAFGTIIAAS